MVDEHSFTPDERYMAAAIRLSRQNLARTSTNPSVATLIVKDLAYGPVIVGSGVTATGGRPHAEAAALAEAGDHAKGATAYVTLEPCAHHGRTPPCAEALISAGVARVVSALSDPDDRVAGAGYDMLRKAGIKVEVGKLAKQAETVLGSYLNRSISKRAQVTLKLAVSADGMIGKRNEKQLAITGPVARAQSHILRSQHDAILIGAGTARIDDPSLTCRLPGLEDRSPARIVLDTAANVSDASKLMHTIDQAPLYIATAHPESESAAKLAGRGAKLIACVTHEGKIALPELLEDLAAIGMTRILVEGGAETARSFLEDNIVDEIALFESNVKVGDSGVASPLTSDTLPDGFQVVRTSRFGEDRFYECRKS